MSLRQALKRSLAAEKDKQAAEQEGDEDDAVRQRPAKRQRTSSGASTAKKNTQQAKQKKGTASRTAKASTRGRFRPKGYRGAAPAEEDDDDEEEEEEEEEAQEAAGSDAGSDLDSDDFSDESSGTEDIVVPTELDREALIRDEADREYLDSLDELEQEEIFAARYEKLVEQLRMRKFRRQLRAKRQAAKANKKGRKGKASKKKAGKKKGKQQKRIVEDDDDDGKESSAPITRSSSGTLDESSLMPSERRALELKRTRRAELIARAKWVKAKQARADAGEVDDKRKSGFDDGNSDADSVDADIDRVKRKVVDDDDYVPPGVVDDDDDDDDGDGDTKMKKDDRRRSSRRGSSRSRSPRRRSRSPRRRSRSRSPRRRSHSRSRSPRRRSYSRSRSPRRRSRSRGRSYSRSRSRSSGRRSRERDAPMLPVDPPLTVTDMNSCRLTRYHLSKWCHEPYFKELVPGTWIKVGSGRNPATKRAQYKAWRVKRVVQYRKTYRLEATQTKYALEVYGPKGSTRALRMDVVSNHRITEEEFNAWVKEQQSEGRTVPTQRQCQELHASIIDKTKSHEYTAKEIQRMVAWRSSVARNVVNIPEQRERLQQQIAALELVAKPGNGEQARQLMKLRNRVQELEDELQRRLGTVPKLQRAKHAVNVIKKRTNTQRKLKLAVGEDKFERAIDDKLLESNAFVRRPNRPQILWRGDLDVSKLQEEMAAEKARDKERAAKAEAEKKAKEEAKKAEDSGLTREGFDPVLDLAPDADQSDEAAQLSSSQKQQAMTVEDIVDIGVDIDSVLASSSDTPAVEKPPEGLSADGTGAGAGAGAGAAETAALAPGEISLDEFLLQH